MYLTRRIYVGCRTNANGPDEITYSGVMRPNITLNLRGRVVAAVQANKARLARKKKPARKATREECVVEIGVQAMSAEVIESILSSWMDVGCTRSDGGCGKWILRA
jgi:hypothetical protein